MAALPECRGCNVLLISLDTFRADRIGRNIAGRSLTPNLDAIRSRSVEFTSAYTNAYFTTPSHMTVFTSLYPNRHRVESRRFLVARLDRPGVATREGTGEALAEKYKTLAEVLKDAGYRTYWRAPIGLRYFRAEDGFTRGFDDLKESFFVRGRAFEFKPEREFDPSDLKLLKGDKPAFMFLHSYVTHLPLIDSTQQTHAILPVEGNLLSEVYKELRKDPSLFAKQMSNPPAEPKVFETYLDLCSHPENMTNCFRKVGVDVFFHTMGQIQTWAVRDAFTYLSREEKPREIAGLERNYDNAVKDLDTQVGLMWQELERTGASKNTLVVFFSDHGEALLEHGLVSHTDFYETTTRVPLIIYHPRLSEGRSVNQLVSLVDVMPTILKTVSIEGPRQMQGHAPWEKVEHYAFGFTLGMTYISDGRWKLMRDAGGPPFLFYLPTDPNEQTQLAASRMNIFARRAEQRLSDEIEARMLHD